MIVTEQPASLHLSGLKLRKSEDNSARLSQSRRIVRDKEKAITTTIKAAEKELRAEHPWLNYQDTIGTVFFSGSLLALAMLWSLYYLNRGNWVIAAGVIIGHGLAVSVLHELEHDIIHNIYFRKQRYLHDIAFFVIWWTKLHFNPWFRREIHLRHHIVSGQEDDAEERLIGLGLPFSFRRIALSVHPQGSLFNMTDIARSCSFLNVPDMILRTAPTVAVTVVLMTLTQVYLVAFLLGDSYVSHLPLQYWPAVRDLTLMLVVPNLFRTFCLVVVSNCSHYYGDIPRKSVMFQNQILDHPSMYVLQLFCFNFGATHIVHHYVPNQPFYLRQMVYNRVKGFMLKQGVRYNDFGVVHRANRFFGEEQGVQSEDQAFDAFVANPSAPEVSPSKGLQAWVSLSSIVGMICYYAFDICVLLTLVKRTWVTHVLKKNFDA